MGKYNWDGKYQRPINKGRTKALFKEQHKRQQQLGKKVKNTDTYHVIFSRATRNR